MERILTVGDCKIPLRSTAASLFSYKANFQRDGMKDLIALAKTMPKDPQSITAESLSDSDFDMDVFYRFLWTFAKSADKAIPPLIEWLDTIEVAPLNFVVEALPQIMELLGDTSKPSIQAKNFKAAAIGK